METKSLGEVPSSTCKNLTGFSLLTNYVFLDRYERKGVKGSTSFYVELFVERTDKTESQSKAPFYRTLRRADDVTSNKIRMISQKHTNFGFSRRVSLIVYDEFT